MWTHSFQSVCWALELCALLSAVLLVSYDFCSSYFAESSQCCRTIHPNLCSHAVKQLMVQAHVLADDTLHFVSCLLLCLYTCFHLHCHSSPFSCLFCFPLSSPPHANIVYYSLCSHSHYLKEPAAVTNGHDGSLNN